MSELASRTFQAERGLALARDTIGAYQEAFGDICNALGCDADDALALATIAELQKRIAELEAERSAALESEAQATDCAKEAHAIVSRVWKALGISTYADAQGKAIDEIVANLLASHKQQLRERREDELRDDDRLGKMMARAEAAEQALTAERQRRGEIEAIAKALASRFRDSELPEYKRWIDYISRHPSSSGNEPGNGRSE